MRQRRRWMATKAVNNLASSNGKAPADKRNPSRRRDELTSAKAEVPSKPRKPRASNEHTEEVGAFICERIARGDSLREICRDNQQLPDRKIIHRWLLREPAFRDNYNTRELGCDVWFDQIMEIADDASKDTKDGKPDWEAPQRSRLRVDARKWICSKLNPRKYGERLSTEISGPNGKPLEVESSQRLLPHEVAQQFKDTLDRMEAEMQLPMNPSAPPETRIQTILRTGRPIPPELYYAIHDRRNIPR
jgi:hypothetical protein